MRLKVTSNMADENIGAIVIDNGTGTMKAGLSGEDTPQVIISTIVGHPRHTGILKPEEAASYIGREALEKREILTLRRPIEHGIICNWEDMEKLWNHIFYNELRVAPGEHPVLLTEFPINVRANREKTLQIMMETFSCPAFYICARGVLSLLASGRDTGVAWSAGEGASNNAPIYQGHVLPWSINKEMTSGRDLTFKLMDLLTARGFDFNSLQSLNTAQDMKDKLAHVALDYDHEIKLAAKSPEIQKSYTLPDGQVVWIGKERFQCMEGLFKPEILGLEFPGVHEILYNGVMRSDEEIRKTLFQNIVISGGTSNCPGMAERMEKEMKALVPEEEVNIIAPPSREFSVWRGGSILASLSSFPEMCISKQEYDEYGPRTVHMKCF